MEPMIVRHRGTLVTGTALAIAVLFLAGVIGALTVKGGTEPVDRSLAAARNAPVDTTPIQPPIDLAPLAAPAPAGYDRTTPDVDGNATADQLVQGRKNIEGAKALFTQLGLENGFVRTWQRTGSSDLLALRLYQFGRVSGAKTYFELGVDARTTPGSKQVEVTGVAGAVGIDAGIEDGHHLAFVYVHKNRVVLVIAASLSEPANLDPVIALARAQHALLP
jgi:hypothetical protein